MPNPIVLAIPLFFVAIAIELVVARRRGTAVYRLTDSVVDLSSGILSQVEGLWGTGAMLAVYELVWQHRIASFSGHPVLAWVTAFAGVDFLYYWWHRLSHEVNVLWAAHVVHHQSEEYNLSVALRQSVWTSWSSLPFYLPLAILGVPTLDWGIALALSTLYQFWIHTKLVGTLGVLEKVLNTPSAHRVHHGINPRYLDKNYGAILIVWDRLFGTYEEEREPVVYGLVKPLARFQPVFVQFHYLGDIARMVRDAPRFADKVFAIVARPDWRPRGLAPCPPAPQVHPDSFVKYDPPLSPSRRRYLFAQITAVILGAWALLTWGPSWDALPRLALSLAVIASTFAMGAWMESVRGLVALELARHVLIAAAALLLAPPMIAVPVVMVSVAFAVWAVFTLREAAHRAPSTEAG